LELQNKKERIKDYWFTPLAKEILFYEMLKTAQSEEYIMYCMAV